MKTKLLILLTFFLTSCYTAEEKKEIESYKKYLGRKVVIDKDTVTVMRLNYYERSFVLSDDNKLEIEGIENVLLRIY